MNFKIVIKKILPKKVYLLLGKIYFYKHPYFIKKDIRRIRNSQSDIIQRLRKKEKLNVIFLVIHNSIWKYEEVYKLLDKDSRYNVKIVVIPLLINGKADMETYNRTLFFFRNKNYHVLSSFNSENETWIDIKATTQPDIVFFTNPHKLTFGKYYINNFTDRFTCYTPYAFVVIHLIETHYNQVFHHYLSKHFIETKFHQEFSYKYIEQNKTNTIVTGFPGLDTIFDVNYRPEKVWKKNLNKKVKKIIWAPHHTILGQGNKLDYSSFNEFSDFFIDLLQKNDSIQIAFKPHPLLKEKLYKNKDWGKVKTDLYYQQWNDLSNGQLEEGAYIDLFYESDAMIMDSASFIVEYLYFDKPLLFTMKDNDVLERFNSFGQKVFNYLYIAKKHSEVIDFIDNTVLKDNDILRVNRNKFLNDVILPKNKKTASENIYSELLKELC